MLCTPKASRGSDDVVVGITEGEVIREDYHGSDFVIVNGTVIPVSRDGKGGVLVINNVNGEVLHHDDGEGNITIFSDPVAGSSTVVPINYNVYDDRPFTGTTASNVSSRRNSGNIDNYFDLPRNSGVDLPIGNRTSSGSFDNPRSAGGINSRRNSGVGLNSRRNSGVGLNSRRNSGVELLDNYLDRRNSREIPAFIPAVLSITSRSRRNSRDSVIEAEARAVQSDNDDDDDSDDSDDSDDDDDEEEGKDR